MRMLSPRPNRSTESAQNKLVLPALFDGSYVFHPSNPNATQNLQKRGDPPSFPICASATIKMSTQHILCRPCWFELIEGGSLTHHSIFLLSVAEFCSALVGMFQKSYETFQKVYQNVWAASIFLCCVHDSISYRFHQKWRASVQGYVERCNFRSLAKQVIVSFLSQEAVEEKSSYSFKRIFDGTVVAIFWARVLHHLFVEKAGFRMRIFLGVVLIRSLACSQCVLGRLRTRSGGTLK